MVYIVEIRIEEVDRDPVMAVMVRWHVMLPVAWKRLLNIKCVIVKEGWQRSNNEQDCHPPKKIGQHVMQSDDLQ